MRNVIIMLGLLTLIAATTQNVTVYDLKVEGMCGSCKKRIEKAALKLDGVSEAVWDLDSRNLHFKLDTTKITVKKVSEAIALVGHDTELHRAKEHIYKSLPAMCRYRE